MYVLTVVTSVDMITDPPYHQERKKELRAELEDEFEVEKERAIVCARVEWDRQQQPNPPRHAPRETTRELLSRGVASSSSASSSSSAFAPPAASAFASTSYEPVPEPARRELLAPGLPTMNTITSPTMDLTDSSATGGTDPTGGDGGDASGAGSSWRVQLFTGLPLQPFDRNLQQPQPQLPQQPSSSSTSPPSPSSSPTPPHQQLLLAQGLNGGFGA